MSECNLYKIPGTSHESTGKQKCNSAMKKKCSLKNTIMPNIIIPLISLLRISLTVLSIIGAFMVCTLPLFVMGLLGYCGVEFQLKHLTDMVVVLK